MTARSGCCTMVCQLQATPGLAKSLTALRAQDVFLPVGKDPCQDG